MKLYLAGPMRGIKDFNFPMFNRVAAALRAVGYEVFSPAEKGLEKYAEAKQESLAFRRKVFALDTAWICKHANGVALLDDWTTSSGATAEDALAKAIGLPSMHWMWWIKQGGSNPQTGHRMCKACAAASNRRYANGQRLRKTVARRVDSTQGERT